MLDIFYTYEKMQSDDFIRLVLSRYYNITNPSICKSFHGKPYLEGRKIHFNLSHSKGLTALAVGKKRVGLDCEGLTGKARPAVLAKFSERERAEIFSTQDFYAHWTARESYVKFYGESLAAWWRKVEFFDKKIWFCGAQTDAKISQFELEGYVFSICGDYSKWSLRKVETQPKD